MNECYICFEDCISKTNCKCNNLYAHDHCIQKYGKIKNFYTNEKDNMYFINCPVCNETTIYNFNLVKKEIVKKKIVKKKKCCIYF